MNDHKSDRLSNKDNPISKRVSAHIISLPPASKLINDSDIKSNSSASTHTSSKINDFNSLVGQFSLKSSITASAAKPKITTMEKTFTCKECNQSFNRAHNLKLHKSTHSASKPYQCLYCSKDFLRLHDLKRHQKLHTGERPYHCPICSRSFSRLDALNRHRKTEGRSACLKSNSNTVHETHSSTNSADSTASTSSLFSIPSMTSQWQLLPQPPPATITSTSTTTVTNLSRGSRNNSNSPPMLPSLILSSPIQLEEDQVETLRQKIHDLEVENRVLRSLLMNNNNGQQHQEHELFKVKRQRTP